MGKYNIIIENDLCDELSEKHFSVDNWLELMGNLCEILKIQLVINIYVK